MAAPLTIDIWSDVICPYCYLGERYLIQALQLFEHADEVVIAYHAFELNPGARSQYDESLNELVARKYAIEVDQAATAHQRLEREAASAGLTWNLSQARPANTFDAHRLIALARDQSRGGAAVHRLFRAYFEEGELVSDRATLLRIGDELQLQNVDEMLTSDDYVDLIRAEETEALNLGIAGVPAMLIDSKFMVNGARSPEDLIAVLDRAWKRRAVR